MALADIQNKHFRLSILRALDALKYTSNDSIIKDSCAQFGVKMSTDQVKTQLGWLAEQGLVTNESKGNYIIATLTGRGQDVAQGISFVDGIQRPSA
jgi:predicted transcriptional regulator